MLIKSKCRTCNDPCHKEICTIERYSYYPTDKEDIVVTERCPCNEYIPSDNLEYLELLNEKRSI